MREQIAKALFDNWQHRCVADPFSSRTRECERWEDQVGSRKKTFYDDADKVLAMINPVIGGFLQNLCYDDHMGDVWESIDGFADTWGKPLDFEQYQTYGDQIHDLALPISIAFDLDDKNERLEEWEGEVGYALFQDECVENVNDWYDLKREEQLPYIRRAVAIRRVDAQYDVTKKYWFEYSEEEQAKFIEEVKLVSDGA